MLDLKRKKKGFFVASRGASRITALCHCDRFIKMAQPAFTTSIFKANPIRFLFEFFFFFFHCWPPKDLFLRINRQRNCTPEEYNRFGFDLFLFCAFYLPCSRRKASKILKDIGLSLQQHQILNHCITPNGLLQEHMLN